MNENLEKSELRTNPDRRLSKPRGFLRFVLSQIAIVVAMLLCVEVLLTLCGVQKLESFNEKPPSTYPKSPDDYIKIAIFGGSAAAGTYSPRGLQDILAYELKRLYPGQKFYVQNYASHGEPFHRHQAEYAKRLVKKYDFLLIYCGNNEAENWYDDSGYWRTPEFKDAKDLAFSPPPDAVSSPALYQTKAWLARHSRLFSVVSRVKDRFQPSVTKNRNRNYAEFELEPSVPAEQLEAITSNFASDVREICELARAHGTQVLLSTAATFETWPPSYSTFDAATSDSGKRQWESAYSDGLKQFELGDDRAAISAFELAGAIDPSVAILNYRLGMCYLRLGENAKGRAYLSQAIDGEGHYFRAHSPLHECAKKLAGEIDGLYYVDVVAAFHQALQGDIVDDDLFVDVCHPSFLGYLIMAHAFLDQLTKLEPIAGLPGGRTDDVDADWKSLAEQRYRELNVLPGEDKVAIAGNILYCFDLMHFCAYPDRCIEQIGKLMARMDRLGSEDPMVKAFNAVCRARLALRQMDVQRGLDEINVALHASPDDLDKILDLKAWNHYIEDEFTEVGIEYSKDLGVFVLQGVPVMPGQR